MYTQKYLGMHLPTYVDLRTFHINMVMFMGLLCEPSVYRMQTKNSNHGLNLLE